MSTWYSHTRPESGDRCQLSVVHRLIKPQHSNESLRWATESDLGCPSVLLQTERKLTIICKKSNIETEEQDQQVLLLFSCPFLERGNVMENLAGRTYGKWTVLDDYTRGKDRHIKWLCRCECGNESYVSSTKLRNGVSLCCGCDRKEKIKEAVHKKMDATKEEDERRVVESLAGTVIGRLTVIGPMGRDPSNRKTIQCQCSCGNQSYIRLTKILNKKVKSCGCVRGPGRRPRTEVSL